MQDDPWKTLGIAPTTDVAAIYDAYNRKIGKLKLHDPAESYSVLMHARTQALAHVYRRPEPVVRPSAAASTVVREHAPRVALRSAAQPPASPANAVKVYSDWPEDQPVHSPSSENYQPAGADWSVLLDRAKLGFGVALCGVFLIMTAVDWINHRSDEEPYSYAEQVEDYEPPEPGPLRERAIAVMAELFGPDFDWEQAAEDNLGSVRAILRRLERSEDELLAGEALEQDRTGLRVSLLFSRAQASRADLVAINRVYLGWLKTAQSQPGDACREVTGRAFFKGVPQMDEPSLVAERALAGRLLAEGKLSSIEGEVLPPEIPASILAEASRRSGMTRQEMTAAMGRITQPGHCEATIALLETALERADTVPLQLLARL